MCETVCQCHMASAQVLRVPTVACASIRTKEHNARLCAAGGNAAATYPSSTLEYAGVPYAPTCAHASPLQSGKCVKVITADHARGGTLAGALTPAGVSQSTTVPHSTTAPQSALVQYCDQHARTVRLPHLATVR